MSLPTGIVTTTITFGTAVTMISGKSLTMRVTFTPTTSLIWAATGTVLIADVEAFSAAPDAQGTVTLINPDQAGFIDGAGNTIRNFGYKVDATYLDGSTVMFSAPTKYITWQASDLGPIDLDTMIPVAASSGIIVSIPDSWSAAIAAASAAAQTSAAGTGLDLLDAVPTESDGHSYGLTNIAGTNLPRQTWFTRLTNRLRAASYTDNNVGGAQAVDAAGKAANTAPVAFRGLILWDCTINDANLRGTAGIGAYSNAVKTWLLIRRASAKFEAESYATETGTWTTVTDGYTSGGTARQTTVQGSRHSYAVSGGTAWAVLLGGSVSANAHGTATIAVDGTTVATVPLTGIYTTTQNNPSRTWFPYAVPVTVPDTGPHTITVTKTDATANPVISDAMYAGPVAAPIILMNKAVYPGTGHATTATVDAYNTALDAAVAAIATDGSILTSDPQAAGFATATMLGDGLHPNNYGAAFIASVARNAVAAITATTAVQLRRGADVADSAAMTAGAVTAPNATGVADNFSRADSTTTLGSTSTGGKAWVPIVGTWGISNNHAYDVSGANGDIAIVNSGLTDQHVSVVMTGDNFGGLVARSNSTASSYYIAARQNVYVTTNSGGSYTSLGTYTSTIAAGDTMEFDVVGSTLTVKQNGTTIFTVTDTTVTTGTYAGFRQTGASTTTRYAAFAVS